MKDTNHITIQGFMRTKLGLSGNDLIVYAIIYGFSQDGQGKFTGSLQYLADWCGATRRGIQKNLKNLVDRGLIIKDEVDKNGITFYEYHVSEFVGGELSSWGGELSSPNNININKENNISTNVDILKEKPVKHKYGEYMHVQLTDEQYNKLLDDFGKGKLDKCIQILDEYIEIKAPKYKNHNLVLRGWVNREYKKRYPNSETTSAPKKSIDEIRKEIYGE